MVVVYKNYVPQRQLQVGRLMKAHVDAVGPCPVQPDQGLQLRDYDSDGSDSGLEGLAL